MTDKEKLEKIERYLSVFCSSCDYFEGRNFGFDLKDNHVCTEVCPKLFKKIYKDITDIIGEK